MLLTATKTMKRLIRHTIQVVLATLFVVACTPAKKKVIYPKTDLSQNNLIPKPVKVIPTNSAFGLDSKTAIYTNQTFKGFEEVGKYLAKKIKSQLNLDLPVNNSLDETVERLIFINQTDSFGNGF